MRRQDVAIALLWAAILIVIGLVVRYALGPLLQATAQVLAAVVSAMAIILGGILTHAFTQIREQDLAQRKTQQENYKTLLAKIDQVIRTPNSPNDEFVKVHLESWVVGSAEVIQYTRELLDSTTPEKRKEALEQLLKAMRKDVGLSSTEQHLGNIFLPPATAGGLPPAK